MEERLSDIEAFGKPDNVDKVNVKIIVEFIKNLIKAEDVDDKTKFEKFCTKQGRIFKCFFSTIHILYHYRIFCAVNEIPEENRILNVLQKKPMRNQSGVMVVTIFTPAEFSCEHDCYMCPNEPGQARSYLKKEPGVARANKNNYICIAQMRDRCLGYYKMGHPVDKIELVCLGGTWSEYKKDVKEKFISDLYYAANTMFDKDFDINPRPKKTLKEEMLINQTTKCHIIGLGLETRPDKINPVELTNFRRYGVTKVLIGVQTIYDVYLERINRGCNHNHTIKMIQMLKDNGFKIQIHVMFDLPQPLKKGVNPKKPVFEKDDIDWSYDVAKDDKKMTDVLMLDPRVQVDEYKLYPTMVTDYTRIKDEYLRGVYKPYGDPTEKAIIIKKRIMVNTIVFINFFICIFSVYYKYYMEHADDMIYKTYYHVSILISLSAIFIKIYMMINQSVYDANKDLLFENILYFMSQTKPYMRVDRIIRDIPVGDYVIGGTKRGSMGQDIYKEIENRKLKCMDIRYREIKRNIFNSDDVVLMRRDYYCSWGTEVFLSFETKDENHIIGFLRLRLSPNSGCQAIFNKELTEIKKKIVVFPELVDCAMIREVHVYGGTTQVDTESTENSGQHKGYGTMLVQEAVRIAKEASYSKISVISGVGVMNFYRKFGFEIEGENNFMLRHI